MKQKLALACALMLSAVSCSTTDDRRRSVSRRRFWNALAHWRRKVQRFWWPLVPGEAERCHRVALMRAGALARIGAGRIRALGATGSRCGSQDGEG
jgi:hypothetical protein